jgi:hypothetical protein
LERGMVGGMENGVAREVTEMDRELVGGMHR